MAFRDDLKAAMTRAEAAEAGLRDAEERAETDQELIAQLQKELGESQALLKRVHARLEQRQPTPPMVKSSINRRAGMLVLGVTTLFIVMGALAGGLWYAMRTSSTESVAVSAPSEPVLPQPVPLAPPPPPPEPLPPPVPAPEPEPPPAMEVIAPGTICTQSNLECYGEHDHFGAVSGRVEVRVAEDGSVSRARFVSGDTPRAVRRCIVSRIRERSIAGFEGGAAEVTCTWSGQIMGGSMMMQFDSDFERL